MGKGKVKKTTTTTVKTPFVTLCTPTFNRRPFIPMMLKCFEHQTYPKDKIEWIIVDDGTDKIEDLVSNIPQVRYFKLDEKKTLGQKRNFCNDNAKGDILIYIDDDDYYPPERISHAVETLNKNPKALCAGSSAMFIYFKHISKMYQFGPYGPNHATAATFAFKRELLSKTRFNETSAVAEEKHFLKDYTIPFVQLEPKKSILVFSHNHNSFDKKTLLEQMPNPTIHETTVVPSDIVKEKDILKFFMEDIDDMLSKYEPGKPENKPDVTKQIAELKVSRESMAKEHMQKQIDFQNAINRLQLMGNPQMQQEAIIQQERLIKQITQDNEKLKEKVKYLEDKIKQIINEQIQKKMLEKKQQEAEKKQQEATSNINLVLQEIVPETNA
jgi:glycosyltransferase involved in cell wall biosynthesis